MARLSFRALLLAGVLVAGSASAQVLEDLAAAELVLTPT